MLLRDSFLLARTRLSFTFPDVLKFLFVRLMYCTGIPWHEDRWIVNDRILIDRINDRSLSKKRPRPIFGGFFLKGRLSTGCNM